jgi:hypothetical protein
VINLTKSGLNTNTSCMDVADVGASGARISQNDFLCDSRLSYCKYEIDQILYSNAHSGLAG